MKHLRQFMAELKVWIGRHQIISWLLSLLIVQLLCIAIGGGLLTSWVQTSFLPFLMSPLSSPVIFVLGGALLLMMVCSTIGLYLGYRFGMRGRNPSAFDVQELIKKLDVISKDFKGTAQSAAIQRTADQIDEHIRLSIQYLCDPSDKTHDRYYRSLDVFLFDCLQAFNIAYDDLLTNIHWIKPILPQKDHVAVFRSLREEVEPARRIQIRGTHPATKQGSMSSMFADNNKLIIQVPRSDPDFSLREEVTIPSKADHQVHIIDIGLRHNGMCLGILRIQTTDKQYFRKIIDNPLLPTVSARLGYLLYLEELLNANQH